MSSFFTRYVIQHLRLLRRVFTKHFDVVERLRELSRGDRDGHVWAATRMVTSCLFRGQRAEGRTVLGTRFGCVDGHRIKAYVNSHPEAFDVWMDASIATISLPFDSEVWSLRGHHRGGPFAISHHTMVLKASRDTSTVWLLVWMDTRASLRRLKMAAQGAKKRAQSIANRFCALLKTVKELDQRDPVGVIKGTIYLSNAILAYRVREFEIDLDFNKQLKLEGLDKQRYLQCAMQPLKRGLL
jgi:hypothetical protein